MSKNPSRTSYIVPIIFFCSIVAIDTSAVVSDTLRDAFAPLREFFILIILLLFSFILKRHALTTEHSVVERLQRIFFLTVITFALMFIITPTRLIQISNVFRESTPVSLYEYLLSLANAVIVGGFSLLVLAYLRGLVYLKRKRTTARNFKLFVFLLFIFTFFRGVANSFSIADSIQKIIEPVLLYALILLMVINAIRVSWINYLNKRQKIASFWSGFVVIPMAVVIAIKVHGASSDASFSVTISSFAEMVSLFFVIYLCAAYGALLLHLPTATVFDRKIRQLTSLRDLSRTVSSVFNFDELVDTITRLSLQATDSNFSWLLLDESGNKNFRLVSSQSLTQKEQEQIPAELDNVLVKQLCDTKEPLLLNEVSRHSPLKELRQWKRNLGSVLAVPLISSEDIKGILCVAKREEYSYEQDDQNMLMAFADQAVVALENSRLIQESILKERFEEELKIAHDAQMKLLPKEMPRISKLDLDATCITANEVGGDYYDFFHLHGGKLGIVIADVSGKGPAAAFYMAEIKGILESFAQLYSSPKELLIQVNKTLYQTIDRKTFITMVYAVFEPKQRKLTFCRAGHCPPILCNTKDENYNIFEPAGLGLGLDKGPLFNETIEEQGIRLKKGDTFLLYTDGVIEARNINDEEFGEKQLGTTMIKLRTLDATDFREQLVNSINGFVGEQQRHDDLTFVVMRMS